MKTTFWLIICSILLFTPIMAQPAQTAASLAIQPLGSFDADLITIVKEQILQRYNLTIVVLPEQPLPQTAYYPPRARYRAEKLALYLEASQTPQTKILGLTTKDISTTKGEFADWGIFGLALLNRRPCVVSTHRLGRGKTSKQLFIDRLTKVVNHEIGHTFGLNHCPNQHCLMEDARGSIRVVDGYQGFCADCTSRLKSIKVLK